MKAIKTFLFTSLMVFLPVILSAQTVSGKLIDEKEKPLPFANVVLLSLPDSAFVRYPPSDIRPYLSLYLQPILVQFSSYRTHNN